MMHLTVIDSLLFYNVLLYDKFCIQIIAFSAIEPII